MDLKYQAHKNKCIIFLSASLTIPQDFIEFGVYFDLDLDEAKKRWTLFQEKNSWGSTDWKSRL